MSLALPSPSLVTGPAYRRAVTERVNECRRNLAHADNACARFPGDDLAENYRDLCRKRLMDALVVADEFGVNNA